MFGILLLICRKKSEKLIDNKPITDEVALNEVERENLLLYRIQGGVEVDQVKSRRLIIKSKKIAWRIGLLNILFFKLLLNLLYWLYIYNYAI